MSTSAEVVPFAAAPVAEGGTLRAGWWQYPVIIFIIARVLTLLVAFVSAHSSPVSNPFYSDAIFQTNLAALRATGVVHDLIEPWDRWDTGWYMKIAVAGYDGQDGSIIFAPLYPAMSAAVGASVGDTLLGGLIVSSVACLCFLLVMYRLAWVESGRERVARNTLLLLVTFPTAFYLMAAYTESLFLVFAAAALLAARDKRWILAGVLAGCASLVRLQGWILFFPIGWMAFIDQPRYWQAPGITFSDRIKGAIPRLIGMAGGPAMTAFFLLLTQLAGWGSISDAYDQVWKVQVRAPWVPVIDTVARLLSRTASLTEIAGMIALLIIVALWIGSARILRAPYHLYIGLTLLFILLRYYPPTLLNGTMRYVLDFFPLFIGAGVLFTSRPRGRLAWVIVGVTLQALMVYLFARWMWIA